MTTPALVYVRISRDREGANVGVDRQEKACRELAAQLDLTVVGVFADNDTSAYSGKPRPGYRDLCTALEARRARTVLVWHTDRLHRHPAELEGWISLADPLGVVVRTVVAGELDLATPAGRMVARQLGAVARYEVEHRSSRIKAQKQGARAEGRYLGGPRPFGYAENGITLRSVDARGELVPGSEADLIRTATTDLLAGRSLRSVVRSWDEAGSRTTRGRRWGHKGVRDVLRRWRNAGIGEHEGAPTGPARWPAIVTPEQLQAVRSVLEHNEDQHAEANAWGNRARWLLSGIALCGGCGMPLRAITGTQRPRVYRCTAYAAGRGAAGGGHVTRIAEPIDALVNDVMAARLARPDVAEILAVTSAPAEADAAALRERRRAARERLDLLAAMLGDGDLTRAEHTAASARARARLDEASRALADLQRSSPAGRVLALEDPAAWWADPDTDLDDRRELIRALLRIVVHRQGPGRRPFDPATIEITPAAPNR